MNLKEKAFELYDYISKLQGELQKAQNNLALVYQEMAKQQGTEEKTKTPKENPAPDKK
jgi:exonuclease VII small subunit